MILSDAQIKSFQGLYERFFNEKISEKDAYEKGVKLLRIIELIYKPMTKSEYSELQKSSKKINNL